MGGNTYNRKNLADDKIAHLAEYAINNPLHSIRSDRIYTTEKLWKADVARYLDNESSNKFYYLIETYNTIFYCKYCDTELGIESFSYSGWSKGMSKYCPPCTKNGVWRSSLSPEKLKKRGAKISKVKLEFYKTKKGKEAAKTIGRKNSIKLKQFFKTKKGLANIEKTKKLQSETMKRKILSGEFTPNSNNRNTHWNATFANKNYRSSWEALYQYHDPQAEYETLRIPYMFKQEEKIYIVDFINHNTKQVIEVKPLELTKDDRTKAKLNALQQWADVNGYEFVLADQSYLRTFAMPTDQSLFDANTKRKIIKLYE